MSSLIVLGTNFPWSNSAYIYPPSCLPGSCDSPASQYISLETGLVAKTGAGLQNFVSNPGLNRGSNGGQIYGPNFFQNNTPDARLLQISAKYSF